MMMTLEKIPAIVDNVIRLKRDTLGPELLSELRDSLTRENPAYFQMKRMRDRNPYKMMYAKLPPATISSIEEDGDTVYVPRGIMKHLIESAKNHGKELVFFDERIAYERDNSMAIAEHITLKDYQKRAIGQIIMNGYGVLVAPCGGGKTVMGVGITTVLRQPTLILVHTNDLLSQWRRELAEKSLLPGGIGVWGGGEKKQGQVVVATIQSLIRSNPSSLREWLSQFGCVILDEAHHCPAETFMSVINLCPARYRFGLTATPRRKDGLEFLMHDVIGPIVAEITDTELTAEGRSQPCVVREVQTKFFTRYTADEWTKLLGELTADAERNQLIVESIHADWMAGHFPLALSERVSHCHEIAKALRARGMNAHVLVGEVPKNTRDTIVDHAKRGLIDAIVATKVADEGLDIPQLSCIHLMTPTANEAKTQQRIGRIRRPIEGKTSLVVDYQDLRVPALMRMSKARKSLYRRWGFKFEDGSEI